MEELAVWAMRYGKYIVISAVVLLGIVFLSTLGC